jgi:LuxR family maltose regulon positive regulatory protein
LTYAESLLNDKVSIDLGWATYIMLAETALLKDNRRGYERYKTQAKEYFESRGAFYYIRNFAAYEARAKLWDGDKDAAQDWLSQYFVGVSKYNTLYKIYQNFTTARAYIVTEDNEEALRALDAIMATGKAFGRLLDVAEADVLIAVVEWISGKKKEARDRLYNLLAAIRPYGFIRVVANEGKAVLPILAAVIKEMDKETDKDETLYRFVKEINVVAYEQSKHFKGMTHSSQLKAVKLSPKQTLILELLSKGHKNAEIIKITGYSINTIRSYTRIIYQKLEVTSAMDAIVKAKQLGILN